MNIRKYFLVAADDDGDDACLHLRHAMHDDTRFSEVTVSELTREQVLQLGLDDEAGVLMNRYLVIGTYNDNAQRFAEIFTELSPGRAENAARFWAEAAVEIAGVVLMPDGVDTLEVS